MILETKTKAAEEEPQLEPSKEKSNCKKSPLELREEFINEIKKDEKNINDQIFKIFFFIIILHFFSKIII